MTYFSGKEVDSVMCVMIMIIDVYDYCCPMTLHVTSCHII